MAQEQLDKDAAAYLASDRSGIDLSDWEKIEGIAIPQPVRDKHDAEKHKQTLKRIEELRAQLTKLESEVAPAA
ncbi:hypothetical protein D3C75_1341440 [compost metagenome]